MHVDQGRGKGELSPSVLIACIQKRNMLTFFLFVNKESEKEKEENQSQAAPTGPVLSLQSKRICMGYMALSLQSSVPFKRF